MTSEILPKHFRDSSIDSAVAALENALSYIAMPTRDRDHALGMARTAAMFAVEQIERTLIPCKP